MGATIAVDAMGVTARSKGVPRTLLNLLREMPLAEPRHNYVALVNGEGERTLRETGVDIDVRVHRPPTGLLWELGGSARAARASGARVLYTMREVTFRGRGMIPFASDRAFPFLVLHLHEPPWYRRDFRGEWPPVSGRAKAKDDVLARLIGPALRRAECVITSSAATREALAARFRIRPEVVHLGVDPAFLVGAGTVGRERFVLHLASGDPRENTPRVLEAWGRAGPPGFGLVVAGVPPSLQSHIQDSALHYGADGTVEVLGWVTDSHLARLYRRAWALLTPSLYEGFGLEGLEALALGTPVVAGDGAASREVLGEAALFADARSVGSIERAIREVTCDRALRKRLQRAGPERAAGFQWSATASRLAGVFARVAHTTPLR
jgi:glycosyltransferase involved in cell wall biosynthesis